MSVAGAGAGAGAECLLVVVAVEDVACMMMDAPSCPGVLILVQSDNASDSRGDDDVVVRRDQSLCRKESLTTATTCPLRCERGQRMRGPHHHPRFDGDLQ